MTASKLCLNCRHFLRYTVNRYMHAYIAGIDHPDNFSPTHCSRASIRRQYDAFRILNHLRYTPQGVTVSTYLTMFGSRCGAPRSLLLTLQGLLPLRTTMNVLWMTVLWQSLAANAYYHIDTPLQGMSGCIVIPVIAECSDNTGMQPVVRSQPPVDIARLINGVEQIRLFNPKTPIYVVFSNTPRLNTMEAASLTAAAATVVNAACTNSASGSGHSNLQRRFTELQSSHGQVVGCDTAGSLLLMTDVVAQLNLTNTIYIVSKSMLAILIEFCTWHIVHHSWTRSAASWFSFKRCLVLLSHDRFTVADCCFPAATMHKAPLHTNCSVRLLPAVLHQPTTVPRS